MLCGYGTIFSANILRRKVLLSTAIFTQKDCHTLDTIYVTKKILIWSWHWKKVCDFCKLMTRYIYHEVVAKFIRCLTQVVFNFLWSWRPEVVLGPKWWERSLVPQWVENSRGPMQWWVKGPIGAWSRDSRQGPAVISEGYLFGQLPHAVNSEIIFHRL
jgi:hypothetical protein